MGGNFFDWDQEPDDNEEQDSEANPSAPAMPAAAPMPSPEGETGDSEPAEAAGPPQEEPDDEQTNLEEHAFEQSHAAGREKMAQGESEKKRVGAIASRELAWGLASKTLDDIPWNSSTLDKIREAARHRTVNEMGLAQDLRIIAGDYPQHAAELHNAADKLIKASQQVSEAGNVPSNALPLGQQEAQQKLEAKNKEISGVQEQLKTSGLLTSPALKAQLERLRGEQGALANTVIPDNAPEKAQPQRSAPTPNADISKHLDATPGGYPNFIQAVQDKSAELQKMGINISPQDLMKHVPLDTAMAMLLKTDPQDMSGFKKFLTTLQDPSGRGEPGVAANAPAKTGDDPALLQIQRKQQRYQQILNQLGKGQESQNWLSAIGMFITAILVGPKAALMIWGRAGNERSLQVQLHAMHEDIQQSIQMRQYQQNMDYKNRSLAARQQNSQDLEGRRETASLTRIFIQHQLAVQRAKETHGLKDQDAKDLTDEFKRHMSMAGQALHEATDPTQFDQNVKNAAMAKAHTHQKAAEAINKMLEVPESKAKAFLERKNGVPAPAVSAGNPE
jgi:hypothetical protein